MNTEYTVTLYQDQTQLHPHTEKLIWQWHEVSVQLKTILHNTWELIEDQFVRPRGVHIKIYKSRNSAKDTCTKLVINTSSPLAL